MTAYIARRILLMFPTLLGILFVSFVVVQFAPGGPVERVLAQLSGADTGGTSRVSGGGGDFGPRGQVGASADAPSARNTAARRGWILTSSRSWKRSSASTSRRRSASR